MGDRVILHCDLNAFYASAESRSRPELRRVPMAVCGDPAARRGIILAKNELAKRAGVQTAETVASALRKCPQLVLVAPHHERYAELSREVNAIYETYTDQVEPFGIDESWLDVTGSRTLFGSGEQIADALRDRIRRELGLTISVGVSFCKVFAKLGSDLRKPDATTVIPRERFREIVWPLPASSLLYVGRRTAAALESIGVRTIGELAGEPVERLRRAVGKLGDALSCYARGEDDDPVRRIGERDEPKSVGNGMTFARDLVGRRDFLDGILLLADDVASRLRRCGMVCRTVQLQIKSPELQVISRQRALGRPTALAEEIAQGAIELMESCWNMQRPVRALTVTAQNLSPEGESMEQQSLFTSGEELELRRRRERIAEAVDGIRDRYGMGAVVYGSAARGGALGEGKGVKKTQNGRDDKDKNG